MSDFEKTAATGGKEADAGWIPCRPVVAIGGGGPHFVAHKTQVAIDDGLYAVVLLTAADEFLHLGAIAFYIGDAASTVFEIEHWDEVEVIAHDVGKMEELRTSVAIGSEEMIGPNGDAIAHGFADVRLVGRIGVIDAFGGFDVGKLDVSSPCHLFPIDFPLVMRYVDAPIALSARQDVSHQPSE